MRAQVSIMGRTSAFQTRIDPSYGLHVVVSAVKVPRPLFDALWEEIRPVLRAPAGEAPPKTIMLYQAWGKVIVSPSPDRAAEAFVYEVTEKLSPSRSETSHLYHEKGSA